MLYFIFGSTWPGEGYSNTKTSTNNSRKDLEETYKAVVEISGVVLKISGHISAGSYAVNVRETNKTQRKETKQRILFFCKKTGND